MVMSDFRPEVEIWPFFACAMYPAIIIGTARSLWTWLWGRYHVPQNAFLVHFRFIMSIRRRLFPVIGLEFLLYYHTITHWKPAGPVTVQHNASRRLLFKPKA